MSIKYFKTAILGLLFFLTATIAIAQQSLSSVVKAQAADMARAVLRKDLEALVHYLPPKLVEQQGGMAKMMQARDTVNKYMTQFGAEIKNVNIGNPGKIYNYKNRLQCILPQTTQVKMMNSLIVLESSLIAISEDAGKNWYFVDTAIYGEKALKSSLPNLSPELVIPERKKPQIITQE